MRNMDIVHLLIANSLLCLFATCKEFQIQSKQANIEGVKGKELTMTWNLGEGNDVMYSQLFLGDKFDPSKKLFEKNNHPLPFAKEKFGDRISSRGTDRTYHVKLENLQYDDIGSFTLDAIVRKITKDKVKWVDFKKTIKITKINGPPELKRNTTNEAELKFVLSGVPAPKFYWGFMKNKISKRIHLKDIKKKLYINEYSMHLKKNMCGKTIYFKAIGYKNHMISWHGKPKFKCVSPVHNIVSSSRDEKVTLIWTVYKESKDDKIKSLKVYKGSKKNDTNLLLKNDEFPTKYAKEIFEERLLHAKVAREPFKTTYIVKLLSAQYSDAGDFCFEAIILNKTSDIYVGGKITLLIKDRQKAKKKASYYSYIWVAIGLLVFLMVIAIPIVLRIKRKRLRINRSRLRKSQSSSQNESDTSQQMTVHFYTEINGPAYVEINDLKQNGKNNTRPYYENMLPAINKYNKNQGYMLPVKNCEYLELLNDNEETKYINKSQLGDFCQK